MPIDFDEANKYILITSPTTFITALEIYNAAMQWADDQAHMDVVVPIAAYGKFDMGGGIYSDSIFVLKYNWKIKPWSGNYQLIIQGTLITDDASSRTVSPDYGIVQIIFQVSSQGTQTQSEDITITRKIQTNRWAISGSYLIIYDDDGITPLKTFQLTGTQTQAFSERTPV